MKKKFPEIYIIAYRGFRTAVGAGIAQALILQPDFNKPNETIRLFVVAFLAGFSVCLGKYLRDQLDELFGYDEKSLVAKTMLI